MKLYTNKVSTGKSTSWNDFVAKFTNSDGSKEKMVKTAAVESDEAPSSGQLDVEPLHQKGESEKPSAVDGKNKKLKAEDEVEIKEAKLEADEVVEYDAGKTEAKLVNHPKVEEETKEAEKEEVEIKEARNQDGTGPAGEGPGTGRGLGKCTDEEKKEQNDKDDKDDDDKDDDDKDDGLTASQKKNLPQALQDAIAKKKASGESLYVKVANLDDKSKQVMRAYWGKIWPSEFINAIIADK